MKKILFFLSVLLCLFLFSCNNNKSNTNSEYLLGCSCPLTGEGANYGRSVKEGVDLAVKEINEGKFLDKPLRIVFEDDKMDPREGVNAINKLVIANKVPAIIGPFGSSIVLAGAPIAEKNKTIIISASATADDIKDAGDYIFRITPPNSKQGSDIADFCVNKLNSKTAAIIYQNNDYGTTLEEAFNNRFKELGGTITEVTGVLLNSSDLKTQLLKIKENVPDVVFFPLHYKESGILLKQAKEMGIESYFISADGAMTEDLLTIAGDAAEGSYYSMLALGYGVADDEIKKFEEAFNKMFNKKSDVYNAYYYEVTWLLANAIKKVGYDTEKIKDFLYNINGDNSYNGITGKTSFDANGEVDKAFYIYQVRNGKYEIRLN